eukprot:2728440-Karenia_brevis.AAC.1
MPHCNHMCLVRQPPRLQVGEVMHLAHNAEQSALDMQDSWQGMTYQAQGARARWNIANERSQAGAGPQQQAWDCMTCDFKNAG